MYRVLGEGPSKGSGIILRPYPKLQNAACVESTCRRCSEDESTGGESDELQILRRSEYTVSHDEAPILPKSSGKR